LAGFETEIEVISASECGAPHERQRVFIIAYLHNLQLRQRQEWTCWTAQIRAHIEIARSFTKYPETKPRTLSLVNGVSSYLAGVYYENWWRRNPPPVSPGLKRNTPGRAEAVSLVGKSIVPIQAAVPLMRLQFLANLLTF